MNGQSPEGVRHPLTDRPEGASAVQVADGVLWMRLPLPMALNHINVYALDDGDGWTIVDTGMMSVHAREVWAALLAGPLGGRAVRRVVVTHHHPDHVGLAADFVARGAELVMPRTAWLMARMMTAVEHPVHPPESVEFYRRNGVSGAILAEWLGKRPFNFMDCVAMLPLGYTRLAEGAVIRMGGRTWDVRMGNGHAPEHATFWSRDDGLVIGGDQFLPGISPNLGVYATEPEADPAHEWIEACERLSDFARDDQFVLPGHKLPFVGLPFRLRQMIANHHEALLRLEAALAVPLRATETFSTLYKREIGEREFGLALAEAVGHLNHLHQTGRAVRRMGEDGAWRWQRA
jgi:glyoxylase-like metal-dependent hydrolase (beta-lactamase superfamily II)